MRKLNWTAYSNKERTEVIEEVKGAISSGGGFITHFQMYSDLAIALTVEVEERDIIRVHSNISEHMTISELDSTLFSDLEREWLILINLSFGKGKGDMKHEVPAVPG